MEAISREHTAEPPEFDSGAPRLAIVADREEGRPEPNVGRGAAIGALVGFVVATVGMTVAGIVGGLGAGGALGLGVFVGLWGGVGFGSMMGGTLPLARYLDTNPHRQGESE